MATMRPNWSAVEHLGAKRDYATGRGWIVDTVKVEACLWNWRAHWIRLAKPGVISKNTLTRIRRRQGVNMSTLVGLHARMRILEIEAAYETRLAIICAAFAEWRSEVSAVPLAAEELCNYDADLNPQLRRELVFLDRVLDRVDKELPM
jgi:hypothetical protein